MIGLDTNVLVRLLVRDDPRQATAAENLIGTLTVEEPGFVATIVWAELHWVLQRAYGFDRNEILDSIEGLSQAPDIRSEDITVVRQAIGAARRGADFADALIAASASHAGCREVVSFDRKAIAHLGWRAL